MTTTLNRLLYGAVALLISAATFDVAGAFAQSTPTTGDVTSTVCGPGTQTHCGTENITKCSFNFDIQFNPLTKGGGISFGQTECQVVGTRALYKDIKTPLGSCTGPLGPGSGPDAYSSRSGGHDDAAGGGECE